MAVAQRSDRGGPDPADGVATVLMAKRDVLLRVYRDRLPHEDLEDCLGQAALELVARARANGLEGERHIANALEQKFVSRIIDRQRALGRRPTSVTTEPGDGDGMGGGDESPSFELVAPNGEPSHMASTRDELERLREVAAELTDDQRLVLACQVSLGMDSTEFCDRFGWSPEKFRKVAQRARARLRTLLTEYELGERCRRLEGDVLAYAANAASAAQTGVVREHLANCIGCAAMVRDLRLAGNRVGALLPVPAIAKAGLGIKLGLAAKIGALWRAVAEPIARLTAASSDATGGAAKACVAAACAATLAGGGHWVAPKLAHGAARGTHAQRAASTATRDRNVGLQRTATEPTTGAALVLTGIGIGVRDTQRSPRRTTVRSRRRAARHSRSTTTTAVKPPTAWTVRPAVTARPTVPPPLPRRPAQRASGTEFGVE